MLAGERKQVRLTFRLRLRDLVGLAWAGSAAALGAAGGWWGRVFALEGGEHLSQQRGELCLFVVVERGEERSFVGEVLGRYLVDQPDAFGREFDEQPAAVLGVWDAPDEATTLEPVEAVGHCSGGAHQREVELGG